jgi:hypothetical protein
MAELYAQALEHAGYKVTRNLGLAPPDRVPAFEGGQVDLVPEYVGSGLGFYDKTKVTGDGAANRTALQAVYDSKNHLATVLAIAPGQDTNAAVVRKDTADTLKLTKMSDLAAVQDQLKWGLPPDCDKNPLCKDALVSYGITYPPKQRQALAACDAPIAQALQNKAIDFAWLCSTQPAIATFGFVTLDDDKKTQPAENPPRSSATTTGEGRPDSVRGDPRRGLGQDDDRRADEARRQGRRRQRGPRRCRQAGRPTRVCSSNRWRTPATHEARPATGGLRGTARSVANGGSIRPWPPQGPTTRGSAEDTSFARGLRVLLTMPTAEIRADELSVLLDTPSSTIYRYLRTLGEFGFVERSGAGYRLGPRLVIGRVTNVSSEELIRLADPILRSLASETGETAVISRRIGLSAVCLHAVPSPQPLRVNLDPGQARRSMTVPSRGSSSPTPRPSSSTPRPRPARR